jgi:hypothetical protein
MSLLELFCAVDDFWKVFMADWASWQLASGRQGRRAGQMHPSEIMTILIHFHQTHYRDFKAYYTRYVEQHLRGDFPHLVSYNRFVEIMPRLIVPLCAYLHSRYGTCTGISFIDSSALAVCDNHRIHSHTVFAGVAARGKTSMGWFFGFKVHLVTNEYGELLGMSLTAGNVDDRQPVPQLARRLFGKLFGDKGYLSQALFKQLFSDLGLQLVTKLRKNMKNCLLPVLDKLLLRKRAIMETIFDQLKNISQIEHTRHRSPMNFLVNLLAGLIAYTHQPKKPSLPISRNILPARVIA